MTSRRSEIERGLRRYIRAGLLCDIYLTASVRYWRDRAVIFEDAMPRPDDFRGEASQSDIDERARRLQAAADECRSRADELAAERDDIA